MNFTKLQGAGNDFILVDARNQKRDWSRLSVAMCDRHYGIGGDGLLLLLLPSAKADFCMRVYNADGSEAEACGNGLRCFVRYLLENSLAPAGADHILIETRAGISEVRLHQTGNQLPTIQVSLGVPVLKAGEIPVTVDAAKIVDIKSILDYPVVIDSDTSLMSFVSLGNPHAVYFSGHPVADFPLSQTGPKVERHRMFPNRVNFEVARVIDRQQIEARVWERGVGETLACGTGAAAIAVIARLHGFIDRNVEIKLPGGTLNVEWDGAGEVLLSGPAETVFTGEWPTEV